MATPAQVENALNLVISNAPRDDKFINGGEAESWTTRTGQVRPSASKALKDFRDQADAALATLITPNFRGAWQPATVYAKNDAVTFDGTTFIANSAFTSGGTFNADLALNRWQVRSGITLEQFNQYRTIASGFRVVNVDDTPYNGDLKSAIQSAEPHTAFICGMRTYNIIGLFQGDNKNLKEGIKIFGKGRAVLELDDVNEPSSVYRFKEGTGTIIQGELGNLAAGFNVFDLSVDCGRYVVDELNNGNHLEGLVAHGVTTGGNNQSMSGISVDNVSVLLKYADINDPSTYAHCFLVERAADALIGNIECIGGFHGFVIKAKSVIAGDIVAYGQVGDSYIIKSDGGAQAVGVKVRSLKLGKQGFITRPGFIQSGVQQTGDVHIGLLSGRFCEGILKPAPDSSGPITDVTIDRFDAAECYGNEWVMDVPESAVNWSLGDHWMTNVAGGIRLRDGCVQVRLGSGQVKGSTTDGYRLGGDYTHENIAAYDNQGFGVNRTSGDGLEYRKIRGGNNGAGLINSLPSAIGSYLNGWSQPYTNAFEANYEAGMVRIYGQLTRGSEGEIFQLSAGYAPTRDVFIPATGIFGPDRVPVEVKVYANSGIVRLESYLATNPGSVVTFDGSFRTRA